MKFLKKITALLMAAAMLLTCTAALADETFEIGIIQLVQHEALDAATQGFKDALTDKLGDRVVFDEKNASGDSANCAMICTDFVSNDVDLIMANATPALQAAMNATGDIPVLGTSVTDYATALDADNWTGVTGINVSGTSDLAPLDGQAQMISEIFPEAKTIALLYCSYEPNSVYQVTIIKGFLEELGYTCKEYSFADSNDVAMVTEQACECDVIYIPTDNTAAAYAETIANVVLPAGTPVFAGEEGICRSCGVATLTIDYYDIGYATGEMAYDILINGADISQMPIQSAPQFTKKFNGDNCALLNVVVPEGYAAIE